MANKMLIDASHVEETRVVVLRDNRVEELDFESEHKKQIKGNIYLAKVTHVEPSLQAAFVDYGENRHGFLPFSEIHPDYYQIPFSDRQIALKTATVVQTNDDVGGDDCIKSIELNNAIESQNDIAIKGSIGNEKEEGEGLNDDASSDSNDMAEDSPSNISTKLRRQYCIQEVIKNRQIILIQVVKEERRNKGAAVTTYLSLAGRYSVLMPNTSRGESVSRKITNPIDRQNLKDIARGLEVPPGMGVILRTAGAARTKIEIKRDFEYLMRLWDSVRELALNSVAPHLVYEEGNLIKRSIRDLCGKDITEIVVSGEKGYREAKDFMKLLMPSYAKIVQPYREVHPIFFRSGIEAQLACLHHTEVTLPSKGYIIINQTEALVAIDVNSGRSTREHSIENTALQTNLEASEEIARQLRLRDLAGLVVVDFIDMEEKRNNRSVEKKLKDSLKKDRARVQVGSISHFGLLEMSRQRIRSSVLESTTQTCGHCGGAGYVRSQSSLSLSVLRSIEEYLLQCTTHNIIVHTNSEVVLYLLNQKRATIIEYEKRFGILISIVIGLSLGDKIFQIEKGSPVQSPLTIGSIIGSTEFKEKEKSLARDSRSVGYDQQNHNIPSSDSDAILAGDAAYFAQDMQDDYNEDENYIANAVDGDNQSVSGDVLEGAAVASRRRRRRRNRRRRPVEERCEVSASDVLGPVKNIVDDSLTNQDMGSFDARNDKLSPDNSENIPVIPDIMQDYPEIIPEKDNYTKEPQTVRRLSWWKRRKE
ncbi:MAG: ribonuclease E/G [Candidatus Liberibacter ctenarytainae]|uniref:Ribonuclease G n=1 Tax=Candidatus Liberibacter ctenarytainae TaxID=2020335 RepID=A0A937DGQ1_9HYPH|nr:ribonuclease E/G [Candidatus Liberibacter ctenarytainae]